MWLRRPAAYPTMKEGAKPTSFHWAEIVLGFFLLVPLLGGKFLPSFLGLSFFVFPLLWWIGSRKGVPTGFFSLTIPFLVMICAGLTHAYDYPRFEIAKDVWYMGNTALMLGTGFVLGHASGRFESLARPIIVCGLVAAVWHLTKFAINPSVLLASASTIRAFAGTGSGAVASALVFMIVARWLRVPLFGTVNWLMWPFAILCLASFVLTFSRTGYVAVAVKLVILFGIVSTRNPRRVVAYGALLIAALLVAATVPMPSFGRAGSDKFLDKTLRSFEEIRIDEYYVRQKIDANWRGYESARAWRTYKEGRPDEWLFGKGLGTRVDLGLSIDLSGAGRPTREAPVLHNGYLYVLVKSGLVGVAAMAIWFFWIGRVGAIAAAGTRLDEVLLGRLLVSSILTLLLTNWTTSSLFPKMDSSSYVVLGMMASLLLAYRRASGADVGVDAERVRRPGVPSGRSVPS